MTALLIPFTLGFIAAAYIAGRSAWERDQIRAGREITPKWFDPNKAQPRKRVRRA
jgi:hypothetical protein